MSSVPTLVLLSLSREFLYPALQFKWSHHVSRTDRFFSS